MLEDVLIGFDIGVGQFVDERAVDVDEECDGGGWGMIHDKSRRDGVGLSLDGCLTNGVAYCGLRFEGLPWPQMIF